MGQPAVCIAGGGEFSPSCDPLDRMLDSFAPPGPVVIVPAATRRGGEYRQAGRNGLRHHRRLFPERTVLVATDPRDDPVRTRAEMASAAVIVLPGGSPQLLLEILTGPLEGAVEAAIRRGAAVSGASAGAMVLCTTTMLPGRTPTTTVGLGLLPGAVLPHHPSTWGWRTQLAGVVPLWGLPECTGIVLRGGVAHAAGAAAVTVVSDDGATERPPGESWTLPDAAPA